jgi:uncharacterized protein YqeY
MLQQKISNNLKEALKSGDAFKAGTLRLLISALHNKEIEKKGKGQESILSDEEVIEVLSREAKKRREASEIYSKGNRADLADKEKKELEIIMGFLPTQLSPEEIEKVILAVIEQVKPQGPKDFGRVMAEVMKELRGRAEAGVVSEIVKKKIGN